MASEVVIPRHSKAPPAAPSKKTARQFVSVEEEVKKQIMRDRERLGEEEYEKRKNNRVQKEVSRLEKLKEENEKYLETERENARKKLEALDRREKERKERLERGEKEEEEEEDNLKETVIDFRVDPSLFDNTFGLPVTDYRVKERIEKLRRETASAPSTAPTPTSASSQSPIIASTSSTPPSKASTPVSKSNLTLRMAAATLKTPSPGSHGQDDPDELILFADSDDDREVISLDEDDDGSIDLSDWERDFFSNDRKVKDSTTGKTFNMKPDLRVAIDNDGPNNSVIFHN